MNQRVKVMTRAGAAALVACALVVGPVLASPASAELQSFQSRGEGYALRVVFDFSGLPAAAKTQLNSAWAAVPEAAKTAAGLPVGEFPFVIDQYFVRSTANASDSTTKAVSVLGDIGETAGAWGRDLGSVSADAVGQSNSSTATDPIALPTADLPLITATIGSLSASVASGPKVDGNASIASVSASLDMIGDTVPELRAALDTVFATVNSTVDTVNDTVDSTSQQIFDTLVGLDDGTPLAGTIDSASEIADSVDVPNFPNPLGNDVSLASIQDIVSNTTAAKSDKSSADAVSTIKAVDVLDGFLKVGLINLAAHSEAAGTAGSARNAAACSLADVRIGGNNGVSLDGKNVYVELGGKPVALPVPADQVNSLKGQVDSLLAQAGVEVELCDTSQSTAAADGTSASQTVSAFIVTVEPKVPAGAALPAPFDALGVGDSLGVKILIDPTVTTQVGATSASPALAAPAQLPRTGPAAVATMISGAMLAFGALALRRRVR